jgi:AbrB family looped-hinge helix DNA binding protein
MAKTIVKPTSKGQVTIPKEAREALDISPDTLLRVDVEEGAVVFRPLAVSYQESLREYSAADIDRFLSEDRLPKGTQQWVKHVLGLSR